MLRGLGVMSNEIKEKSKLSRMISELWIVFVFLAIYLIRNIGAALFFTAFLVLDV